MLAKARAAKNGDKFCRLWAGDTSGHGDDDSAADLALLSMLAFYTQDPAQLDRLFRRSGLYRGKWEREDYRRGTIAKAILDRADVWAPAGGGPTLTVNGKRAGGVRANGRDGERANTDTGATGDAASGDADDHAALPAAPEFPLAIFPEPVQAYLSAAAASIGESPVEMVAMPFLAICGALIGNRLAIRLKRGFVQLPTLFVAIIAEPGSAKSPLLDKARWPLDKLQHEAHEDFKHQSKEYEAALDRWNALPKEERAGKEKPERPRLRHYYSTDLTIEALTAILADAPGVAIVRDEILSWVKSLDQYRGGKGADRQQYLSLWAGSPIKADRRTGDTVYQPWPVAAVCGGIQPDYLADLHDKDGKRDGFIERVLPIRPDADLVGWNDDELDPDLLDPVLGILRGLNTKLPHRDGDDAWTVELHPDAREVWASWHRENEAATRRASGLRRGFYAKLPNHVARFALILHALGGAGDPRRMVSAETMGHATALGEFVRTHIERTLPLIGVTASPIPAGLPTRIVRILSEPEHADGDGWVARSELLHSLGNVLAVDLTAALNELRQRGHVESRRTATGTKPVESWRLIDHAGHGSHSHYSHYSDADRDDGAESANNANANDDAAAYDEGLV